MSKYNLKIKEGNQEIDETIEINTDKETEKINIPSNGDNSQSAPGEVDVVFDFKLVSNTMHVMYTGGVVVSFITFFLSFPFL